jgi:flagellar hook-associated protein 3 FlgL
MRVSTASQFERSVQTLQQRQQALQASQEQIATGKRVLRPSDDPIAAVRAERAMVQQHRIDADLRALEASRQSMAATEAAVGDASGLMQRVRELVLQAGNPTFGPEPRKALVEELRVLRQQLFDVANRPDGAGGYLFGGAADSSAPFQDTAAGVVFRGRPAGTQAAGVALPLAIDGQEAWMRSASGNGVFVTSPAAANQAGAWIDAGRVTDPALLTGRAHDIEFADDGSGGLTWQVVPAPDVGPASAQPYATGRAIEFDGLAVTVHGEPKPGDRFEIAPSRRDLSLFDAIDHVVAGLAPTDLDPAQVTQTVQSGLRDLDAVMATLVASRSRLGAVLGQIDGLDARLADQRISTQSARSAAEDVDLAQAVSDFQVRQTSYDAALKAYSMVQRLSLFEYIR